jgi:hypothetical protein
MRKTFALLVPVAAFAGACSWAGNAAAPQSTSAPQTAVQRAVRELQHARFGPYTGDAARPLLRSIRCAGVSADRIRCSAVWDGHPTKPIVFGVKPNGALYVVVAGPLAIS